MIEQWKKAKNFEERYEVSTLGNVRSIDRVVEQRSPKGNSLSTRFLKGKLIKPKKTKFGYYEVSLYVDNSKKISVRVHRLVADTFIPNIDNKPHVNHKNANKLDNYIENLEWVTPKENANHAHKNGLIKYLFGENHQNTNLTKDDVNFIRENYKYRNKVWNTTTLSKKFNVSVQTILNIANHKTWI